MTGLRLGAWTPVEYRLPPVRAFNRSLLRAYAGMRQSQKRWLFMRLPIEQFPIMNLWQDYHIILEHAQDNAHARLLCQGRALFVKPLNDRLCGVCPDSHGGPYLSQALIYTFLIGE